MYNFKYEFENMEIWKPYEITHVFTSEQRVLARRLDRSEKIQIFIYDFFLPSEGEKVLLDGVDKIKYVVPHLGERVAQCGTKSKKEEDIHYSIRIFNPTAIFSFNNYNVDLYAVESNFCHKISSIKAVDAQKPIIFSAQPCSMFNYFMTDYIFIVIYQSSIRLERLLRLKARQREYDV